MLAWVQRGSGGQDCRFTPRSHNFTTKFVKLVLRLASYPVCNALRSWRVNKRLKLVSGCSAELVTVVVPAYNASETIDETLWSVRNQTHANLEILVVDDGSTDETCAVVGRHMARDGRVRLLQQANGGVAHARNHALNAARGRYVAPVDADDLWRPDKIARQLALLRQRGPDTTLVYTWYATIDRRSRVRGLFKPGYEGRVLPVLCTGNFVGHASSPLMRTEAVLQAGGYDPALREQGAQGCEDWKLYLSLAAMGEFAVVKDALTGYRQVGHGMSGDIAQMLRSHHRVMSEFQQAHPGLAGPLREGLYRMSDYYVKEALKAQRFAAAGREFRRLCRHDPRIGAYLLYCSATRLRPDRLARMVQRRVFLREGRPGYDRAHPHFLTGQATDADEAGHEGLASPAVARP